MTYVSADQEAILRAAAAEAVKAVIIGATARKLAEGLAAHRFVSLDNVGPVTHRAVAKDDVIVTITLEGRRWLWHRRTKRSAQPSRAR